MKRSLFSAELMDIIRNKKLLIPIIAILFVPVLYSGMFLWAFWDPYARMDELPVAVVNSDSGATFEGEELHLGNDLVKKLTESDEFKFQVVDKNKGYNDLNNRKYYLLIEIPENFSENATTLLDDEPQKLELKYIPNESHNFLSAQIGETAIKEIKSAVSKEVIKTYSETMFAKVQEMADGFVEASDGAKELNKGAGKLQSGSKELKENLETLASKSIEFEDGVTKIKNGAADLYTGTDQLATGLNQLATGHEKIVKGATDAANGAKNLETGAQKIKTGLETANKSTGEIVAGTAEIGEKTGLLANKLSEFQTGAKKVSQGANDVHAGIQQLKSQIEGLDAALAPLPLPDEAKKQLAAQLKEQLKPGIEQLEQGSGAVAGGTKQLESSAGELQSGASLLAESITTLNNGQQQLKTGLGELSAGSKALVDGTNQLATGQNDLLKGITVFDQKLNDAKSGATELKTGASQLNNGIQELAGGSSKISEGSRKLADGSSELADGTDQLLEGTTEMKDKLGDAADQASDVHSDEKTYDMMGEPVQVDKHGINKVPNYGTGFAPYFLSLGLFVGALLLSIVFPLREPATRPKNGFSWFFSKFGVIAIVGVLQSLLAVAIMLFGLKIEVQSVPLFILTTIVTSLTFISLVQCLVTLFNDAGRFIAILILILQLTTSAGTFPLELIPHSLQVFNAGLPMTYTVQAYKAVISSGDFSYMWHNLGIISLFLLGTMVFTLGFFQMKHKRQFTSSMTEVEA